MMTPDQQTIAESIMNMLLAAPNEVVAQTTVNLHNEMDFTSFWRAVDKYEQAGQNGLTNPNE